MTITEFLTARLGEWEARPDRLIVTRSQDHGSHLRDSVGILRSDCSACRQFGWRALRPDILATVAALRAVVETCRREIEDVQHEVSVVDLGYVPMSAYVEDFAVEILRALASIWRDHEDWREKWR